MLRKLLGCLSLALVLCGAVQAEEIKGKIKNINGSRLTIGTGAKDRTIDMSRDVKVFGTFSQKLRRPVEMEISNGLGSLQPNQDIVAVTEGRGRAETVTAIKILGTQQATTIRGASSAPAASAPAASGATATAPAATTPGTGRTRLFGAKLLQK